MAWNISQCKEMIAAAKKNDRILSIGHQRHYSMLYAHAAEVLRSGILGDVKMIRALWHRNNSWPRLGPDGRPDIDRVSGHPYLRDGWTPPIPQEDVDRLAADIRKFGYKSMEELVRWRLFNRTGGGLMAELGSHQLDACSIFLGKVHPLAVMGVGGRFFYSDKPAVREVDGIKDVLRNPRESDDIVAVTYEFPGKAYYERDDQGKVALDKSGHPVVRDREDVVVVTYTSLNTNSFEAYGECVMGSRGTLVVEGESSVMLYPERNPNPGTKSGDPRKTAATVDAAKPGAPAMESGGTWGPPTVAAAGTAPGGAAGAPAAPPSRGYQEEMEDFAYCIRMWNQGMGKDRRLPRCHGTVAMADAIIALSANRAMKTRQRIEFQHAWFQPETPDVPDADTKPETV
jgi:predicted dehydrogenase